MATPIGNIDDFSQRGKDLLANADLVLAEDTRRTYYLCSRLSIKPKKIISFFDHNENERIPEIIEFLKTGKTAALVTDAGTPLLSDPGYRLVAQCRKEYIPVSCAPGPSAVIAALSISGLPPIPFTFLGFLPRSAAAIRKTLIPFRSLCTTIIFFERKDRVKESLNIAISTLGPRKISICRELTKLHEEVISFVPDSAESNLEHLLGEITVVIGPPEEQIKTSESEVKALILKESVEGYKAKKVAQKVAASITGWQASEIYALMLKENLKENTDGN